MKTFFLSVPAILLVLFLNVCMSSPVQAESVENMNQQATPTLYYDPACSHCHKVLEYVEKNDISIVKKNIRNDSYKQELINLGARSVPVLVVNSRMITGSSPIIAYLDSKN
jgi:glutaredoxin